MTHHSALAAIDEAFDRTKTLLWPPKFGVWIRITIIALFLGGGVANPFKTGDVQWSSVQELSLAGPLTITENLELIVAITIGLLVAGLIYVIISAIFQFIFVDCLSSGKILLTRTFSLRWRKGLQLVCFYLVLLLIICVCAIATSVLIIIPALTTGTDIIGVLISIIITLILLLILLIPVWIIAVLTADFVVPVMIVDDTGIISGFRQVFYLFHSRWFEVGIYIALKILLMFGCGIILGALIFLVSIPLGLTGAILTIGTINLIYPDTLGNIILVGMGTIAMILISLLLLVPVVTFFRYYSLAVLRDISPKYNLLPAHDL
jgi:hypothetical protein